MSHGDYYTQSSYYVEGPYQARTTATAVKIQDCTLFKEDKNGCQMVALMLPHRRRFAGLLLAISLSPFLK